MWRVSEPGEMMREPIRIVLTVFSQEFLVADVRQKIACKDSE